MSEKNTQNVTTKTTPKTEKTLAVTKQSNAIINSFKISDINSASTAVDAYNATNIVEEKLAFYRMLIIDRVDKQRYFYMDNDENGKPYSDVVKWAQAKFHIERVQAQTYKRAAKFINPETLTTYLYEKYAPKHPKLYVRTVRGVEQPLDFNAGALVIMLTDDPALTKAIEKALDNGRINPQCSNQTIKKIVGELKGKNTTIKDKNNSKDNTNGESENGVATAKKGVALMLPTATAKELASILARLCDSNDFPATEHTTIIAVKQCLDVALKAGEKNE